MTHSRFDKLNASLQTSDLDAVILNPGPTLTYLVEKQLDLGEFVLHESSRAAACRRNAGPLPAATAQHAPG